MFEFLYFHNCSNVKLGPTGACYQKWNNHGVRVMLAKIRLTTNIIIATVVVSLLTITLVFVTPIT